MGRMLHQWNYWGAQLHLILRPMRAQMVEVEVHLLFEINLSVRQNLEVCG